MPLEFFLVNKRVEDVGDRLADVGAVGHKLAVDAMENCLEVITFTRIFAVEEFDDGKAVELVR